MDLIEIIKTVGYFGIFAAIFSESGLLIGFFLPGDSLIFTSGFLASQGYFNVYALVIGFTLAAIIGDSVGYAFGKSVGKSLFNRSDSMFFKKKNLVKAKEFYEKHGKKTIVLARFVPIVRTFAPVVAGMGDMKYNTFVAYNILGGILWGTGITLAGYFLGNIVPDVDKYLLPIVILIIVVSMIPSILEFSKDEDNRRAIRKILRRKEK